METSSSTDLFNRVAQSGANPCEKIPTLVFEGAAAAARAVADEIDGLIRSRAKEGRPCVLGLATGSTPVAVYRELVRRHREEGLSFADVISFNLDEYYPCEPERPHSYRRFMQEQLFDHVDIDPANTHVPDGSIPRSDVPGHCEAFEKAIRDAGGIDLQLLGIGRTGHIGFNEPGASGASRTRLVTLHATTLADNRKLVPDGEIPLQAITMGVGSILEARRIILMALGEHKRAIVRAAVEGPVTTEVTATFLQNHPAAIAVIDDAAAGDLTRSHAPWLLGPLSLQDRSWDEALVRQSVAWLSLEVRKPVLKLEDADYARNGLEELLAQHGPAYDLNLRVFRGLQNTVTGWPAGRPEPGSELPVQKRVVVFSPHPDDDVLSMGGTLARLARQGHEVHIAYMVSGSNAVSPDYLARQIDCLREAQSLLDEGLVSAPKENLPADQRRALAAAVRRAEARSAALVSGVPPEQCHFLDLPFYDTPGRTPGDADRERVLEFLASVGPAQIYAAGDVVDPQGTHRLCLELLEDVIHSAMKGEHAWTSDCEGWLYRGPWADWRPHEIDRAIPLSPDEVLLKRRAILQHQSQRDERMLSGQDARDLWQHAEDRAREAAELYRRLGWAEYAALETLARWSVFGSARP